VIAKDLWRPTSKPKHVAVALIESAKSGRCVLPIAAKAFCERAGVKLVSNFFLSTRNYARSRTANFHSSFAEQSVETTKCGTQAMQACCIARATDPIGSYAMANRRLGPALVLGVVSVLSASMATPSVGQTRPQGPGAQEQGFAPASPPSDETFGQATRAQAPHAQPDPMANRQPGSCWIPTNEDFGVGYWGACSNKGSRPVK
jgi:hypothetical protein